MHQALQDHWWLMLWIPMEDQSEESPDSSIQSFEQWWEKK